MNKIVAIHQPNFFPWLGLFAKIFRSDVFVLMDDVAYPKSGNSMGCWTNRVKIMAQDDPVWFSCPVIREHGVQLIKDVKINDESNWREQALSNIRLYYKKADYYASVAEWLAELLQYPAGLLADFNSHAIMETCRLLGIDKTFVRQSSLATSAHGTELLIEITRKVQGGAYLCGNGAAGYQVDQLIQEQGLELIYQSFKHPIYKQYLGQQFVAGLSIIDALMHVGTDGVRQILQKVYETDDDNNLAGR